MRFDFGAAAANAFRRFIVRVDRHAAADENDVGTSLLSGVDIAGDNIRIIRRQLDRLYRRTQLADFPCDDRPEAIFDSTGKNFTTCDN